VKVKTTLRIAAVGVSFAAALAFPAVAYAGSHNPPPYVGTVKAGGDCTAKQAKAHAWGSHGGHKYECRKVKPGCYLFKRVIDDGEQTGQWHGGPARCPKCTPKPSGSPSPSASATPSSSPSATPTASPSDTPLPSSTAGTAGTPTTSAAGADVSTSPTGGTLPVTPGTSWQQIVLLVASALALIAGGWFLLVLGRRRRAES
jgi:hypothetical protein